jgi:hypothetical protein
MIGPGDYFQAQVNYTEGAVRYTAFTPGGSNQTQFEGGDLMGMGVMSDGVYCGASATAAPIAAGNACPAGASSVELTTGRGCGLRAPLDPEPARLAGRQLHRHQLQWRCHGNVVW